MSTEAEAVPDTEIGQLMDRFMRHIHCELGRKAPSFDPDRVGPAGGLVLMTLADLEPVPLNELVRFIARDKAQITRLLQSLDRKGLVERSISPIDGRVCVVALSEKGQDTVARLKLALAETIDGLLTPLNVQERNTLKSLLKRVFE
ncbi:MAG: MarR family transcriptional regulator [Pseudomonadota bacterium]